MPSKKKVDTEGVLKAAKAAKKPAVEVEESESAVEVEQEEKEVRKIEGYTVEPMVGEEVLFRGDDGVVEVGKITELYRDGRRLVATLELSPAPGTVRPRVANAVRCDPEGKYLYSWRQQ